MIKPILLIDEEDLPITLTWQDKVDEHREAWESCEECLLRLCEENSMDEVTIMLGVARSYLYVLIRQAQETLGIKSKKKPRTLISGLRFNYRQWLEQEKVAIRRIFPFRLNKEDVRILLWLKCCRKGERG